ncbi:thymidine phosphorylase [Arenibacterium halophilum]|uniref:Thymidine phosphorylase n=1 Tax=Arenibacterium halophilum TaxID=2583821 RepID=A0ABY2X942_9RHOB|nr:thymidine phosphorylase [Arenibacterium halophilum]TMV12883.1 thymidine phosphorylase [Arenibacterium halophilum]
MDARAIIARLRKGEVPSEDQLRWFAQGLADGGVSDAQAGAFAMAVCMGQLGTEGRAALTRAMRDSGKVMSWSLPGPVVDKHSTGGVGDAVSFLLAPALAECGAFVPMISGRGLGHTGGTLDKLESVPGVATLLPQDRFQQVVASAGCAIVGATGEIAPADKRLYAIRDVTATVESLDLITASILSKKLAEAPDALVLDVKTGSGAFMKTPEEARALAKALTETAQAAGCPTRAVVSDMSQPLAPALGNALEIAEVMRVLTEACTGPLARLTAILGGEALCAAGLAKTADAGKKAIFDVLADGRAAERFGRMLAAQGGPLGFVDNWARFLPEATVMHEVTATETGYITAIDGEALGLTVVGLGGGRQVESDTVDPAVGLSRVLGLGEKVQKGTPLAVIHASREDAARRAEGEVRRAYTIGQTAPKLPDLVLERIG